MRMDFLNNVRYCILHGWQGLPEQLPSDLDIAVAPEALRELESALLGTEVGQLVNLLQHETTCYYFVLALREGEQVRFLAVDAALDYRRDGRVWFSADELLAGRRRWKGFWVAAPEVEFKYLLVKKILKQGFPRYAAERLRELAEELWPKADEEAERLLGRTWGPRVLEWVRRGNWGTLERHLGTLKKVLKRERFRQDLLNPFRYWLPELGRIWRRWRYPTGLFVAVLGPDGAGKSTLIQGLRKELAGAFRRTEAFHLMPGLLRKRGDGRPVTDPHGEPPRSLPGSLLKLAYYLLDYTLGYWLKVRPALVRSTLVLFDRYYDDLLVDPRRYRYGGPMEAARWLRGFIPRPDLFLVLDVPVEALRERKHEVEPEELQRQVKAYRRFALSTPNAILVDGGQPPEEVVRQARDALVEILHGRYLKRRHLWFPGAEESGLTWLSDALGVELGSGSPTHAHLRLPDGRGYLLPLNNPLVFRRGLDLYPAQGRKARLGRVVLRTLARVGLKAPGLRRVRLEEGEASVFRTLREVFGREDLCFAVSLGTPGPHRKPVLQVITPSGEVLGYAKVGWNEATRALVQNEVRVLQMLQDEDLPFTVPRVWYVDFNGERTLCVQGCAPAGAREDSQELTADHVQVLCSLSRKNLCRRQLEESPFWNRIIYRLHRVQNIWWRHMLHRALETVHQDWQDREIPFHFAHGDFAPWNALRAEDRLYLFDWEYTQEEMPAGYDLFHFLVQTSCLVRNRSPIKTVEIVLRRALDLDTYFGHIVSSRGEVRKLLVLYLIDRLSSYYSADSNLFIRLNEMVDLLTFALEMET